MGMMMKQICSRRSGLWKCLLDQINTDESDKVQDDIDYVFRLENIVNHEICATCSDGKRKILPGNFSAFEGCFVQEEAWIVEKRYFLVAPGHCAELRVALHPQLSGKTSDIRCAPSTLISGLIPANFSCFQILKHFWRKVVSKPYRRSGIATRVLRAIRECGFQEAFLKWKKSCESCIVSKETTLKWAVFKKQKMSNEIFNAQFLVFKTPCVR